MWVFRHRCPSFALTAFLRDGASRGKHCTKKRQRYSVSRFVSLWSCISRAQYCRPIFRPRLLHLLEALVGRLQASDFPFNQYAYLRLKATAYIVTFAALCCFCSIDCGVQSERGDGLCLIMYIYIYDCVTLLIRSYTYIYMIVRYIYILYNSLYIYIYTVCMCLFADQSNERRLSLAKNLEALPSGGIAWV